MERNNIIMKKFFAILLLAVLFVNVSPCFADSLLSKFEEQLKGAWESYNILGQDLSQLYKKPSLQLKPNIEKFSFPSYNTHHGDIIYCGKKMVCSMHLFEEGNGDIWLILSSNSNGFYISAKIAMSKGGNFLYIIDATRYCANTAGTTDIFQYSKSGLWGIYKKVAK